MLPKTDLRFIEGSMTGLKYAENILHSIVRLIAGSVGEGFIFMDDNARFHRARIVNVEIMYVQNTDNHSIGIVMSIPNAF